MIVSLRARTAMSIASGGLIAAIAGWLFFGEREPRYQGRSLSYWIEEYWLEGPEEEQAIPIIGTNAFPFLLRWIRTPEPRYHFTLLPMVNKLPQFMRPKWADNDYISRPLLSAHAFTALGNQATPVVPELTMIASDPRNPGPADMALTALSYMGSNGVPALVASIRNPSHPYRDRAVYLLGESKDLGPHTDVALVELIKQLEDPTVSGWAARSLGRVKSRPDLVVPALARCLEKTNTARNVRWTATMSLMWYYEKAEPALPYLTNALNDPDAEVRKSATNTVQQIHLAIMRAKAK
jgi:hypothetical protein